MEYQVMDGIPSDGWNAKWWMEYQVMDGMPSDGWNAK
jgi:hypothetical protein